ncbi:MAG TPA: hypothetical protein VG123_18175, partial [Streptosporangiaceae bacterium]|nr:hypothetical protein [Streptosporangiaceae bacterium]
MQRSPVVCSLMPGIGGSSLRVSLRVVTRVLCGDRWETRCHGGSGRQRWPGRRVRVAMGCGAV